MNSSATANGCLSLLLGCPRDRNPLSILHVGACASDVDLDGKIVDEMCFTDSSSSALSSSDEKSSSSSSNPCRRSRAIDRWCLSRFRRFMMLSRAWSRVLREPGISSSLHVSEPCSFFAAPHDEDVEVDLELAAMKESILPVLQTSVHAAVLVVEEDETERERMLI